MDLFRDLSRQTTRIDQIVLSTPTPEDAPSSEQLPESIRGIVRLISGTRGASAQRNAGLAFLERTDYTAFFDDDARLHPRYLECGQSFLDTHPDAAGVTGRVIRDGAALGRELTTAESESLLEKFVPGVDLPVRVSSLYGCNCLVRVAWAGNLRFDEELPLYSWLEDLDYSRRLGRLGALYRLPDAAMVHRGASSGGRTAHRRFGYSQIANALHLRKNGSISRFELTVFLLKGLPNNIARSVVGPDRAGHRRRIAGNVLALRDLTAGKLHPAGILTIR